MIDRLEVGGCKVSNDDEENSRFVTHVEQEHDREDIK